MSKLLRICLLCGLTAVVVLGAGVLAACREDSENKETDSAPDPDTHPDGEPSGDGPDEIPTEPETGLVTYPAWENEPNAKTVNRAADLANGVSVWYPGSGRTSLAFKNQNAALNYDMSDKGCARVASLSTPAGKTYLTDTGDSYITLADGTRLWASGTSARANIYDQGFYYYDVHILEQSFMSPDAYDVVFTLNPSKATGVNMLSKHMSSGDGSEFGVTDPTDPFIFWNNLSFDTAEVDAILITLRTDVSTEGYLYFSAGSQKTYNGDQKVQFTVQNDGQLHTVLIPMRDAVDYQNKLTGIRFDIGMEKNEVFAIKSVQGVRFKENVPQISIDRNFIVYSDKMNDLTRFIATRDNHNLAAMGTEYRIPQSSVDKLIMVDTSDRQGGAADPEHLAAVGFDVKDVGVIGFILLDDGSGARLTCTTEDGDYVVRQEWTVSGGSFKDKQEITFGRRIYTDEGHDFDAFLYEVQCERHPLTDVTVVNEQTNVTYYAGYNALRGVYEFMVGSGIDFSALYNDPDHHYPVHFRITGADADRSIYVMSHTTRGWLECAALLDSEEHMLPVRLECCKNFAGDGEEPFYTHHDSVAYGYTVFPMTVEAGKTEDLTVVHLYERWGQFRLKQISSIRFFQAYYHQSLGVTETNCFCPYSLTNRLPDHRGLTQPYWQDVFYGPIDAQGNYTGSKTPMNGGPEHQNSGIHTFLQYTDAQGRKVKTENRYNVIDSSGPTYYDITMHYDTTDGCMTASIRHAEMPQYDENRAYTQVDYEVTNTIEIRDFRNSFEIYGIVSNTAQKYTKLGYLDTDNVPQITDTGKNKKVSLYTLGNAYPYFDLFKLEDPDPAMFDQNDLYSNLSVLIRDWDIRIGGKKYEGAVILNEKAGRVFLTLDLDDVTLLPGDHIRVNMILMPWGGYQSQDDENVRLTRENTLVHPIVLTSDTDTAMTRDPWIPKVRSTDGQTAVFTVSGGLDNLGDRKGYASEGQTSFKTFYDNDFNVTVRAYGFRAFGKAHIYEQIDGEWVEITPASDHGYDGYAILYDEDNTFSVSFVVNMNEAKPRTFRITIE